MVTVWHEPTQPTLDKHGDELESRLAYSMAEVREAMRRLLAAIDNAAPNVDFASKQLVEHTENVVQKARADIEAMVVQARPPQSLLEIEL